MPQSRGICRKCLKDDVPLESHHLLPRCHYGNGRQADRLFLCHDCHIKIESLIQEREGLTKDGKRVKRAKSYYLMIAVQFLRRD